MQQAENQAELSSSALATVHEPQEEIPCPLCGERANKLVYSAHDALFARPGEYRIVACSACGMRYVSPRPTLAALGAHYPIEYGIYQPMAELPSLLRALAERGTAYRWKRALRRLERVIGTVRPEM